MPVQRLAAPLPEQAGERSGAQQSQAGPDRVVTEYALDQQWQQHQTLEHAHRLHHSNDHAQPVAAQVEQTQIEQRRFTTQFQTDKSNQAAHGDQRHALIEWVKQRFGVVHAADGDHQQANTRRNQQVTDQIKRLAFGWLRVRQHADAHQQCKQADGHIHQEQRAPAKPFQQQAAAQRTERRRKHHRCAPQPGHSAPFVLFVDRENDRQRQGNQQPAGYTLHHPSSDHQRDGTRQRTQQRATNEQRHTPEVKAFAPDALTEKAGQRHGHAHTGHEPGDDPGGQQRADLKRLHKGRQRRVERAVAKADRQGTKQYVDHHPAAGDVQTHLLTRWPLRTKCCSGRGWQRKSACEML
ncbi:hypothetical protein ALP00_05443 [Pseudomonas coronafaciens pv. porri]|nr:hypothetical protein ALP00_05443 [Pseudomonas coronafaciens pv. porri]